MTAGWSSWKYFYFRRLFPAAKQGHFLPKPTKHVAGGMRGQGQTSPAGVSEWDGAHREAGGGAARPVDARWIPAGNSRSELSPRSGPARAGRGALPPPGGRRRRCSGPAGIALPAELGQRETPAVPHRQSLADPMCLPSCCRWLCVYIRWDKYLLFLSFLFAVIFFKTCGPLWAQQCGRQYYATGVCSEISPSFEILRSFSPAVQSKATCPKQIQFQTNKQTYQTKSRDIVLGTVNFDILKKKVCAKSKVLGLICKDWQIAIQCWCKYGLNPLYTEVLCQCRLKTCVCSYWVLILAKPPDLKFCLCET